MNSEPSALTGGMGETNMLYRGGRNPAPQRRHIRFGADLALCGTLGRTHGPLLTDESGSKIGATCKRCLEISRRLDGKKLWLHG